MLLSMVNSYLTRTFLERCLRQCIFVADLIVNCLCSDYSQDWSHSHLHHHRTGWERTRGVLQVNTQIKIPLKCLALHCSLSVCQLLLTCPLLIYTISTTTTIFSCCSRLKKIQEKKKQLRERTDKEIAARLAKLGPIAEPSNMLTEETDEDLLFEWQASSGQKSLISPIIIFILWLSGHIYVF